MFQLSKYMPWDSLLNRQFLLGHIKKSLIISARIKFQSRIKKSFSFEVSDFALCRLIHQFFFTFHIMIFTPSVRKGWFPNDCGLYTQSPGKH